MTHLVYTGEEDVYKAGVYREIYDPACGTGGMLSVSEQTIRDGNASANLGLYGQEYNDESWAICCSDMLIKDEETDQVVLGDTLGDGKTSDGFPDKKFHYMLANPPFGVEWKDQQKVVVREHEELGFSGRFGAGLPAINDGSLLFLQHMISKMHATPDQGGEGSKIAIIFNGSPLFSGDAGSGPSNIRRWIIENDWLDAIVALFFDQVRETAERDEKVVEAAQANSFPNFSAYFGRILEDLFIERMEGNEEIFRRVMSDKKFRGAAEEHLAREVYEAVRKSATQQPQSSLEPDPPAVSM